MDREKKNDDEQRPDEQSSESSALRPAQVAAAALAAVTAAFLGSSLGVYGTVLGAGLISVLSTVGSEFYLRSLDRTKEAARALPHIRDRTKQAGQRQARHEHPRTSLADQPTIPAAAAVTRVEPARMGNPGTGSRTGSGRRWWKRRWPAVAATSVLAFVLGMIVITSYEGVTGRAVSGASGTTVGSIVNRSGQQSEDDQQEVPEQQDRVEVPREGEEQPKVIEPTGEAGKTPPADEQPEERTSPEAPKPSRTPEQSPDPDRTPSGPEEPSTPTEDR